MNTRNAYLEAREEFDAWIRSKPVPDITSDPECVLCSCIYGHIVIGIFVLEFPEFDEHKDRLLADYGDVWFMLTSDEWAKAKQHALAS